MSSKLLNGNKTSALSGLVLKGHTPDDVARAMIQRGEQRQPFHIFSVDEAYHHIQHFKKMMPRVKICYAMKANDHEVLLRLAISQATGFDCASPGEIKKIIDLGASPQSIIYALPSKMPEEMIYARKSGVKHTTFDSSYELKKIRQYWPDASLLIRIRVDSDSVYRLGDKFGCDFDTEARNLLDEAAALGLRVAGVAFHVGSGCFSPESYEVGLRNARALFEYESRAGRRMSVLDIGGGFLSDRIDSIDEVANIINGMLEELFPDPNIQVVAEPGRYLCDSAFTLYANISNIRTVKKGTKVVQLIYMNDGIHGTLRYTEVWHTVRKFKISDNNIEDEELHEVLLFGPTCDSIDRVMADREVLLPRCTPFDWLVFRNQGAYTIYFATNFSALPIPMTRTVVSAKLWRRKLRTQPLCAGRPTYLALGSCYLSCEPKADHILDGYQKCHDLLIYKDMYLSLVHNNQQLDDVQKMHYLKGHLTGEAEQLLRHVPITSANYKESWSILNSRNKLKTSAAFNFTDFNENADISAPLPFNIPALPSVLRDQTNGLTLRV